MDQCCGPISDELDTGRAIDLAEMFKALADPVRLRLLSIIASQPEVCACDLTQPLDRSQATVSHHLSRLVEAGLVVRAPRGKWAWFSVAPERADFVRAVLEEAPAALAR